MKQTLGVLITYFNERDLLRECLESLLEQQSGPEEILIYDDASDFPAGGYLPKDPRIEVIRSERNRGPACGRNVLLKRSRSEYIHFHDADDLFHPNWCQRIRQVIDATGPDLIVVEISSYRGGALVCERVLGLDQLIPGGDLVRFALSGSILTSATVFRRKVALVVGGYRESLRQSEDFDYHVRLASSSVCYAVIKEPLISKRLRESSYSSSHWETVWTSVTDSVRLLSQELPQKYRLDLAEAAARAGSTLYRLGSFSRAREAFRLARELGPPTFSGQRRLYRTVARIFGPEAAEWMGSFYRGMLPKVVRSSLAGKGW